MSKEDHPNFHAVKFTTAIVSAFYESLRGEASVDNCPDISEELQAFIYLVETKVDECAKEKQK